MKLLIIAAATAAMLGGSSAYAQNPQSRVKEPEALTPGQPTVGPPQRQAPVKAPGSVGTSPYGAKGGATGAPNPDRVPPGTPGGQSVPPD
jgi:hypothetical protein